MNIHKNITPELFMEWCFILSIAVMPIGRTLTGVLGGLGTFVWGIQKIRKKDFKLPENLLKLPILFLFAAMLISSLFSMAPERSFNKTFTYALYFFYFFAIVDIFTQEQKIKKLYISMAVCTVLISLDGLFQFVAGFDLIKFQKYDGGQVDASFGNKSFGSFLSVWVPFVLALIELKQNKMKEALIYMSMALVIAVLFLTGSRSAMIGILSAIVVMGIFAANKKRVIFTFSLLLVIFAVIFSSLSSGFTARAKTLLHPIENQRGERIILWSAALRMFKDSPVVGQGTDSYRIAYQKFKKDYGIMTGAMHPHNIYLQVLSETGILGILALFSIMFSAARMLWFMIKNRTSENEKLLTLALAGSFTSFFTSSLGNQSFFVSWWAVMMWYILAMIAAEYNQMVVKR